jgi:hypothetical protein
MKQPRFTARSAVDDRVAIPFTRRHCHALITRASQRGSAAEEKAECSIVEARSDASSTMKQSAVTIEE